MALNIIGKAARRIFGIVTVDDITNTVTVDGTVSVDSAIIDGVDYVPGNSGIDSSTESIITTNDETNKIHSNDHYFIEDFETDFDAAEVLNFVFTTDDSAKWVHLILDYECTKLCQLDIYEGATVTANTGTLVTQFGNNRAKCFSGAHTAAGNNATVMTDSGAAFTVDALIGWKIYNITDGSYGIITDNDATTVTVAALVGGTDNDWDTNDQYEINRSLSIVRANQTITADGIRLGGQSAGDATLPNQGIPGGQRKEKKIILRQNTSYIFRFTGGVNDSILTYNGEWYEHTDKN